jgi:hypothetical protein
MHPAAASWVLLLDGWGPLGRVRHLQQLLLEGSNALLGYDGAAAAACVSCCDIECVSGCVFWQ